MSTLYSTTVNAIGGRNGTVHSTEDILDLQLALPGSLGGKGGEINPEQLFAAGYAACFGTAVIHVTSNKPKKTSDNEAEWDWSCVKSHTDDGAFPVPLRTEERPEGTECFGT